MAYNYSGGRFQAFDSSGDPLAGGKVYTYYAGTTTPLASYTTQAATTPNANPVILDSAGRASIWLGPYAYRIILKTSADVTVWDDDNVQLGGVGQVSEETFIATAGQTLFTVGEFEYTPGNNSLQVLMNGLALRRTADYAETSSTSFTLTTAAEAGDEIIARAGEDLGANVGTNASAIAYDPPGAGAVATNVQARLRELHSVTDYGAVGDGVTDDTVAIQAAITAAATAGGGDLVFPANTYCITGPLYVRSGVRLFGEGYGDASSSASQPDAPATAIKWTGVDSGTDPMILVKATTGSEYVYGAGVDGIALLGNNDAYDGIVLSSARHCYVGKVWIERVRHHGMRIDNGNSVLSSANYLEKINYIAGSDIACADSCGLVIRADPALPSTTATHIDNLIASVVDGNGLEVGDHDNGRFAKVHVAVSGTGHGVYFRGLTDSQDGESRKNFIGLFSGSDIYCEAGSRNVCEWINSEGTSVTIEAGAVLDYRVLDRNDGRRWRTHQYFADDYRNLPLSEGYAVALGTPSLSAAGANSGRVLVMADGTAEEAWHWTVPPLRDWSDGRILGAVVRGIKSAAGGTGDVVFKLSGLARSTSTTIGGGAMVTENFTVTCDADTVQTIQEHTLTLGTPWAVYSGSHFLFRLSRLGTNVSDTLAQDFHVTSVALIYQADVADSDQNGVYRFQRSADEI